MDEKELIKACEDDDLKEVKSLIEKGIDINLEYDNWTPLTKASEKGHLNIVEYLVENGVEIDKENGYGWTALMSASMNGHSNTVENLIKQGANINIKNGYGWIALMWASIEGHWDIVKYLINEGADVDAKNNDGWTALICILKNNQSIENSKVLEELINYLIKNGVSVDFDKYYNGKLSPVDRFICRSMHNILRRIRIWRKS